MIASLKFVQGAVPSKDFFPAMSHFAIKENRITSWNGLLSLSAPIPCNIDCNPNAEQLIKAINCCDDTIEMHLTDAGRLSIKSGKFRVLVDCFPNEMPDNKPEGDRYEIDGERFMEAITKLYPIIGEDASRPWACGLFVNNGSLFATNNIILVEKWLGFDLPTMNIPKKAIKELLRIKLIPTGIVTDKQSLTIQFENDRLLKTSLFNSEWPNVQSLLKTDSNPIDLNQSIFNGIRKINSFTDEFNRVYFKGGMISTASNEEDSRAISIENIEGNGIYSAEMFLKLEGLADKIDWKKPCHFESDCLRGIIVGMNE